MYAAPLAQLAEHLTLNQRVLGSSPRGGTKKALLLQCFFMLVARHVLFLGGEILCGP